MTIRYTVCYETGNEFEPTDFFECTWYWIPDDITTSELIADLHESIAENYGEHAWLGGWEVVEE